MNHTVTFLIAASAATLLACGKPEEAPAPAIQPPALEAPQATPASEPAAPAAEAPSPETVPFAQPAQAPSAEASKPATAPAAPTASSPPSPDLARGQQVYRQACAFCHDRGVAGAPKTGDAAAWGPRLAQGMDTLYAVAVRGKGAMPAKGGNPSLSDADVNAAVDYMIAQSR